MLAAFPVFWLFACKNANVCCNHFETEDVAASINITRLDKAAEAQHFSGVCLFEFKVLSGPNSFLFCYFFVFRWHLLDDSNIVYLYAQVGEFLFSLSCFLNFFSQHKQNACRLRLIIKT